METVYIGIDPTAGRRPIDYAVLDGELRLAARGLGQLDQVLEAVQAYPAAIVAVDAPQGPNQGLMLTEVQRQRFGLSIRTRTWGGYKVCEYELRRRGIRLYATPGEVETAPRWMQLGFELYAGLRAAGFRPYQPQHSAPRQYLEVHPHACYAALLGRLPFRKDTLEGRLQRQLLLFEEGVKVADPMNVVDEITRHHLLEGTLQLPDLLNHDELDALVSAYTAFIAGRHPGRVTLVGDPGEGEIVVPVAPADFKDLYR